MQECSVLYVAHLLLTYLKAQIKAHNCTKQNCMKLCTVTCGLKQSLKVKNALAVSTEVKSLLMCLKKTTQYHPSDLITWWIMCWQWSQKISSAPAGKPFGFQFLFCPKITIFYHFFWLKKKDVSFAKAFFFRSMWLLQSSTLSLRLLDSIQFHSRKSVTETKIKSTVKIRY